MSMLVCLTAWRLRKGANDPAGPVASDDQHVGVSAGAVVVSLRSPHKPSNRTTEQHITTFHTMPPMLLRVADDELVHVEDHHAPSCASASASSPCSCCAAVLLLHGFPDDGDLWRHQVQALTAAGARAIVPDLPGFGRSWAAWVADQQQQQQQQHTTDGRRQPPPPPPLQPAPGRFRLRRVARVMLAVVDALPSPPRRFAAVGHDFGAALAWALAAAAPARVERLVALSVGHPGGGAAVDPPQRAAWWYQLFFCLPHAEQALLRDDAALLRLVLLGAAGGGALSSPSSPPPPPSQEQQRQVDAYARAMARPGALAAALGWYRDNTRALHFGATAPQLVRDPAALLPMPTLGVWGAGDAALREPQMLASERFVAPGRWRYVRLGRRISSRNGGGGGGGGGGRGAAGDGGGGSGSSGIEVGHWMTRDAPREVGALLVDFVVRRRDDVGEPRGLDDGGGGSCGNGSAAEKRGLARARL